ncbi:hypothetical protein [Natrarchaeobaculum sulfurireducens]|uniref:Uncharacterized protein n=1 Tax=Natrarchaeobaculum sulfurireducens TaxID=2044521 RepID=A0A346PRY4_9EURY|nr:hypothetical protein [Natrarchaeobaculum sulfurireducens]AXR82279.1 hypothetical protein AArcMg_2282 [Natrarchaeobaculum sulfurireducens]
MKRVIALTLAVAMIGMAFAGAGTVAAGADKADKNDVADPVVVEEDQFDVSIATAAETNQAQDVNQANVADFGDVSAEQNIDAQSGDATSGDLGQQQDVAASSDDGNSTNVAIGAQIADFENASTGDATSGDVNVDADQNVDVNQQADQSNQNTQSAETSAATILG